MEENTSVLPKNQGRRDFFINIALASAAAYMPSLLLGVVAKYGVTLVKLYAIVSETILVMDASGMNDKIKKELQTLACQVFKEITYGAGGPSGSTMTGLETIIGEIIDRENKDRKEKIKNPFKCA